MEKKTINEDLNLEGINSLVVLEHRFYGVGVDYVIILNHIKKDSCTKNAVLICNTQEEIKKHLDDVLTFVLIDEEAKFGNEKTNAVAPVTHQETCTVKDLIKKTMKKEIYLLNAFSLQMLDSVPCKVVVTEVESLPSGLTSAIGHPDTARVLGVPVNRINITLKPGDIAFVAQLTGGRLPEGATTLPDGFAFKYLKVEIK